MADKLSSYQEALEEEGLPVSRQARREKKLLGEDAYHNLRMAYRV